MQIIKLAFCKKSKSVKKIYLSREFFFAKSKHRNVKKSISVLLILQETLLQKGAMTGKDGPTKNQTNKQNRESNNCIKIVKTRLWKN